MDQRIDELQNEAGWSMIFADDIVPEREREEVFGKKKNKRKRD